MRFLLTLPLCAAAMAQTSPVTGMNNFIHATADLQKTVSFYRDVFGWEKPNPPRPPNPAVPALINAPGAQLQVQVFRLPGAPFGFELTYFGNVDHNPAQPKSTADPGAANLTIRVPDLDPVFAAIKKTGAPILSHSTGPVKVGNLRGILVRDPDGYLVEVLEGPASAAMGLTITDMEKTLKFYNGLLGFDVKGNMQFAANAAVSDLVGTPSDGQSRVAVGNIPGTKAQIEFHEWKGVPSSPFRRRIQDPGCPALALRVADLDGLLAKLKAAGVKIVSAGGVPAQFSPTIRNIFVEDPNGFKIELYQASQ